MSGQTLGKQFKGFFAMMGETGPASNSETEALMAVIVRAVEPADEAQWRALFDAYIEFYKETVPQNVIDLTWQRLVAGDDGLAGLVAINETGAVVGIANLVFHRSTWAANSYCYLEDLYADTSVRGQGVGRALIEATYKLADARGADRTYWATHETNATARKLYDRVGVLTPFVQYRRRGPED
jgi:GNAT superfamily N-acetyltransferase